VSIAAVVIAVVAATVSTGAAQTASSVSDGEYTGVVTMGGGFTIDASEFAGTSGYMVVRADVSGPATITVSDESIDGSWSFDGAGSARGWFGGPGAGFRVAVDTAYQGTGRFSGTTGAARMTGVLTSTGSASLGSTTQQSSDTDPIDESLTNVWVRCGRLYARYDRELAAEIESMPGFREQLEGVLYLRDGGIDDELLAEAAALAAEAAGLAADAARLPEIFVIPIPDGLLGPESPVNNALGRIEGSAADADFGLIRPEEARQIAEDALESQAAAFVEQVARTSPRWILDRAVELLERVERLEAELAGDCPPSSEFRNLLSDAAARIVDAMLGLIDKNQLDVDLMPAIVRLALGAGIAPPPVPDVIIGDDGRIGPKVARAIVEHVVGGGEGSNGGETVSDSPSDGPISSDLAALAVQAVLGE
jgi:hypothetical protein